MATHCFHSDSMFGGCVAKGYTGCKLSVSPKNEGNQHLDVSGHKGIGPDNVDLMEQKCSIMINEHGCRSVADSRHLNKIIGIG